MALISPSCYSPLGLTKYLIWPQQIDLTCRLALQSIPLKYSEITLGTYLLTLGLTCLLELPFYLFATKRPHKSIWNGLPVAGLSLLVCNLSTHPAVYFFFPYIGNALKMQYSTTLILSEIFAPLLEITLLVCLFKVPKERAALATLSANLFSWWTGVYLLNY